MSRLQETKNSYSFLWQKARAADCPQKWHFNMLQEAVKEPVVRGKIGIDVGSGCGYDTCIMARNNPAVHIVSLEVSDGIYNTKKISEGLLNVRLVKSSVLEMPFRDNVFNFAYSFGVLHHTDEPRVALSEMRRVLKDNSPVFTYLYEDHSENLLKGAAVKLVALIRKLSIKIPLRWLYLLCTFFSPLVYVVFSGPAIILGKFRPLRKLSRKIPFNFGRGFFSLRDDLYDRFSAPIEHRFSRSQVYNLFLRCGFHNVNVTRMQESAGWIVWGYKG